MGKIKQVYMDKLIEPVPDRNPNRIFIYRRGEDDCIGIHFRNVSFKLTEDEFKEWQHEFGIAKQIVEQRDVFEDV